MVMRLVERRVIVGVQEGVEVKRVLKIQGLHQSLYMDTTLDLYRGIALALRLHCRDSGPWL